CINSTAFQEASTVPRRSTASSRSSFSVRERRAASPVRMSAPALFTHTSTRPNVRRSVSASASTSASTATSARIDSTRRPAERPEMQLLISVAGPAEARAALSGGADVIDAKDPRRGALGPVPLHRLAGIRAAVAGARPLSAALGDATSEEALAGAVGAAVSVGVAFVKVGFAGVTSETRARRLAVAAQRRVPPDEGTRVVLVAYADWRPAESLAPARIVAVAAAAGAAGVLLNTASKGAPLFTIATVASVAAWVAAAHAAGLFAALAGGL